MAWRCNNIESLLLDMYGNKDGWVDFGSDYVIGMNYDRKLELLEKLESNIKNNDIEIITYRLFNSDKESFEYKIYETLKEKIETEVIKEKESTIKEIQKIKIKKEINSESVNNNPSLKMYLEKLDELNGKSYDTDDEKIYYTMLVDLEKAGVNTSIHLENACKDDCELYEMFGYKDSCRSCGNNPQNIVNKMYDDNYNIINRELPF